MAQAPYVVRGGTKSDEPFIAKSWLGTLSSSHGDRASNSRLFARHHLSMIDRTLRRAGVEVRIAAPADDDFTVYGFAVLELPKKVHVVYVRKPWRQQGIAKALLQGVSLTKMEFSTWSPDVQQWIYERYKGLQYRPLWEDVHNGGREGSEYTREA